jgi:hypothetical protein
MKKKEFNFDSLVGKKYKFYGVDNNQFKLGSVVFEAIEDEGDGYRSYLNSVIVKDVEKSIFFKRAIADVWLVQEDDGYFDGYKLIDIEDGHIWLRFGTDNSDDYYPWFVFEYSPKAPK